MKMYLLTKGTDSINYCEPEIFNDSAWKKEFLFRCEYKQLHELPIPYSVANKCEPSDFPLTTTILVSRRFFSIIQKLNKDYEFFESQFFYQKKEKLWDLYYTIILPDYELFNWEESDYEKKININTKKAVVTNLKKIVLDKRKIQNVWENHFFILSEKRTQFICTETAKKAIEEVELTGINFEELEIM